MSWQMWRTARHSRGTGCNLILKIVTLFLIAIGVLAMFGKLRMPGGRRLRDARCPDCGRIRIGKGPCPCKKKGG